MVISVTVVGGFGAMWLVANEVRHRAAKSLSPGPHGARVPRVHLPSAVCPPSLVHLRCAPFPPRWRAYYRSTLIWQLEDPFGSDENDLPLVACHEHFIKSVYGSEPHPALMMISTVLCIEPANERASQ